MIDDIIYKYQFNTEYPYQNAQVVYVELNNLKNTYEFGCFSNNSPHFQCNDMTLENLKEFRDGLNEFIESEEKRNEQ